MLFDKIPYINLFIINISTKQLKITKSFFVHIIVEEYFFHKCIISGFKLPKFKVINGFFYLVLLISVLKNQRGITLFKVDYRS